MAQQPLTAVGVQTKLDELYALSDNQLATEANAVRSDFSGWLHAHFRLTSAQANYFATIDGHFLSLISAEISYAVRGRLPIIYQSQDPPLSPYSKLIHRYNDISTSFSSTTGITVSGSLTFSIEYK